MNRKKLSHFRSPIRRARQKAASMAAIQTAQVRSHRARPGTPLRAR
jgi:hypothetical protein